MRPIDEKIISMSLNNENFEKNAKVSLSTFAHMNKTFDTQFPVANMNKMSTTLDAINSKMSGLGVVGATVLSNLTNKAVNASLAIGKNLTIKPIADGFNEYKQKMESIQTILSNTSRHGDTLKDVKAGLEELNTYADDTKYNFSQMTKAIGQFTIAGTLNTKQATTAVKGYMNAAADAGVTNEAAFRGAYQLSQAMSSGAVRLIDWKSLENSGIAGANLREQILIAARKYYREQGSKFDVDAWIKSKGSFRDSLSGKEDEAKWLKTDIMTEALKNYTVARGDATAEDIKALEIDLKRAGYNEKEIKTIIERSKLAYAAANDVKTFAELFDQMGEAVGSQWAMIWEYIVGDFEEAKVRLTTIKKSFDAFSELTLGKLTAGVKAFRDAGGSEALWQTLFNVARPFGQIIEVAMKTISGITGKLNIPKLLAGAAKWLEKLTAKLTLSDDQLKELKGTLDILLTPLKAILDIGVKGFELLGSGIQFAAKEAEKAVVWILDLGKSIKDALLGVFNKNADKMQLFDLDTLEKAKSKFGGLVTYIKTVGIFKNPGAIFKSLGGGIATLYESFSKGPLIQNSTGLFKKFIDAVSNVKPLTNARIEITNLIETIKNSEIIKWVQTAIQNVNKFLENSILPKFTSDVKAAGEAVDRHNPFVKFADGATKAGEVIKTANPLTKITDWFKKLANAPIFKTIALGFSKVWESIKFFFSDIQAKDVSSAGLLYMLIDVIKKVTGLLEGVTVAPIKMGAAFSSFANFIDSLGPKLDNFIQIVKANSLKSIGIALGILVASVVALTLVDQGNLANAVGVLAALGFILGALMKTFDGKKLSAFGEEFKSGKFLVTMFGISVAMRALASVVKILGDVEPAKAIPNMVALGVLVGALAGLLFVVSKTGNATKGSVAILKGLGRSMLLLSAALYILSKIEEDDVWRSVKVLGAILAIFGVYSVIDRQASKIGNMSSGLAFVGIAASINMLMIPIAVLALIPQDRLTKALTAIGVLGLILTLMTKLTQGKSGITKDGIFSSTGAFGIIAAAKALQMLTVPILIFAFMPLEMLAKGIGGIAASLLVLVGAAALIQTFGLTQALDALGKNMLKIGIGLGAVGIGLKFGIDALLMAADAGPKIIEGFKNILMSAIVAIVSFAPQLGIAIVELAYSTINALLRNVENFAVLGVKIIVKALELIGEHAPEILEAAAKMIKGVFAGLGKFFENVEPIELAGVLSAFLGVAGLMHIAASIGPIIPSALAGIAGIGLALAEISGIITALLLIAGGFSKIQGFQETIDAGAKVFKSIGKAIGEFVGALFGGALSAYVESLPGVGADLSKFMTNLKPFLEHAKSIDNTAFKGVELLGAMIKELTLPSLLNAVADFVGLDSPLTSFGKSLAEFGPYISDFYQSIKDVDGGNMSGVAAAVDGMRLVAEKVPKDSAFGLVKDTSLRSFGQILADFGPYLKKFADSVSGIDATGMYAAAKAAEGMLSVAKNAPDDALFGLIKDTRLTSFGSKLISFGAQLKVYGETVVGLDVDAIQKSIGAASALKDLAVALPETGGFLKTMLYGDNSIDDFGERIVSFGASIMSYASAVKDLDAEPINRSVQAATGLKDLAMALPDSKTLMESIFGGGQISITEFGTQLVEFGTAMLTFSNTLLALDPLVIDAGVAAGKKVAELAKLDFGTDKGLGQILFGGGKFNITEFGYHLTAFGGALSGFATSVANIEESQIKMGVWAAERVARLSELDFGTDSGLLGKMFGGDTSMSGFANNLKIFGGALRTFSEDSAVIDHMAITSSITSIRDLVTLFTSNTLKVDAVNDFKKAFDALSRTAVDSFIRNFNNADIDVAEAVKQIITIATNTIFLNAYKFNTMGRESIREFIVGINGAEYTAKYAGENIAEKTKAGVGRINLFYTGRDAAQGFINGVNSRSGRAWDAGMSLGRKVYNAIKRSLRIASPSKETTWLGDMTVTPFVDRIVKGGKEAFDAAMGLGRSVLDGLSYYADSFAGLLEGSMNLEPTVKPVLDLTNMRAWDPMMGTVLADGVTTASTLTQNAITPRNQLLGVNQPVPIQNTYQNQIDNRGLLEGAIFQVHEEADIPKIAREINRIELENLEKRGIKIR